MSWLRGHLGSIAMALGLAALTWMWLYSESTLTRSIEFDFKPQIAVDLASASYEVRGAELANNRLRLTVTGLRGVVETARALRPCEPVIDASRFGAGEGSIAITLRYEDLPLPQNVRPVVLPELTLHYVKYLDRTVLVETKPSDFEDALLPGLRVAAIRPSPPAIRVRVPADKAAQLPPALPIEKVRVEGRSSTFHAAGRVRSEIPGLRQAQEFSLEVVLDRALTKWTIKEVPLNLAGPPGIVNRLKFKGASRVDVELEGPHELQKELSAKDLFVYVLADNLTESDRKTLPTVLKTFGCEIRDPRLVSLVRVVTIMAEAQPENRQVEVDLAEKQQ